MKKQLLNTEAEEDPFEDIIQRSEQNIKAQSMHSFKEMRSCSSSRKGPNYNQTVQSASIQSELNQFRLKFKSNSQLKLNNYRDSLEKKISQLKEKIAISYRTTLSSSSIQPYQLSLFYHLLQSNGSICLKLIEFISPNDLYHFLRIKELHEIILSALKEAINKRFTSQYEQKYSQLFNANKFVLCIKHYKKHKKMNSRMYINISSMISKETHLENEYLNKTVYVKYIVDYFSKENKISNMFALDIFRKECTNTYWIFKEYTSFHYDELEKAYYSNIIGFNQGDTMKVSINIFSENGFVNLNTFHWCKLIVKPILNCDWLMSSRHLTQDSNYLMRHCEVEELRNDWKDISQMDNSASFIKSIQLKFEDHFRIGNVLYDDVGYYLFKILLTAKRKGKVATSNDLGISIEVFNQDSLIENFVKKNDLVIEEMNELNIRIGDLLVFYLSHKK